MFKNKMIRFFILLVCILFILSHTGSAAVKSEWRGTNRDGIYNETNLLKKWPAPGPKLLWTAEGLGRGYSSPAVTEDRVFVTGMENNTGYVYAFDINGKQLWKKAYGPEWNESYPGSRTTPTVVDNQIYLMSTFGLVVCMDSRNGNQLWSVDTKKEFGARTLRWGITESLLIDGDRLICTPGGSKATLVALNRITGKLVWACKGNGENSAYCSPKLVKQGKTRLIISMTGRSVIGVDADAGKLLWSHPHITNYDINPNTPIVENGFVFAYSGYGTGGELYKLSADGKKVTLVWKSEELDSQMGAAVLINGYIYGSGHKNRGWKCLDWKTGELKFSSRALGKGNVISADGMLYCYTERGELGLVKPNPAELEVVSSIKITQGSNEHWAHPVIKNGRLYVRHGDVMMVYKVAK